MSVHQHHVQKVSRFDRQQGRGCSCRQYEICVEPVVRRYIPQETLYVMNDSRIEALIRALLLTS